ncbi:MAG: peroxiredoxin [Gemmataceae bacterium]
MLRLAACAAAVAVAAALTESTMADDTMLKVKVGDKFPDVALKAAQVDKLPGKKAGDSISIADLKGKTVIVFFYPRALTGGCTKESCGFRDVMKSDFPKDVVILGASNDDEKLQQKFIDTNQLPYPLLCDTEFKLIKALGIANAKTTAAQRVTFVVDKEGKIVKIYDKVTPASHPKEVLDFVKEMK